MDKTEVNDAINNLDELAKTIKELSRYRSFFSVVLVFPEVRNIIDNADKYYELLNTLDDFISDLKYEIEELEDEIFLLKSQAS